MIKSGTALKNNNSYGSGNVHAMRILMVIIGLLGYGLCVVSGYWLYQSDETRIVESFRHGVSEGVRLLEKDIDASLSNLLSAADFFSHSYNVTEEEFNDYAESVMERSPVMYGIVWQPYVEHKDLADFEQQRSINHPGFKVRGIDPVARKSVEIKQEVYFPITYARLAQEGQDFQNVYGIDNSMVSNRKNTFEMALKQNALMITPKIMLGASREASTGFIAVKPIRYKGVNKDRPYSGIVSMAFSTAHLINHSAIIELGTDIDIVLKDISDEKTSYMFTQNLDKGLALEKHRFQIELRERGGRQWVLEAAPSKGFIDSQRSLVPVQLSILLFVLVTFALTNAVLLIRRERQVRILVKDRTEALHKANYKLSQLASTDALTGIANRRAFDEHLNKEFRRAKRNHQPLTVMLIDIDYFKRFNDFYGHKTGDECLQEVAATLMNTFQRAGDHVSRFGGEEFAVILSGETGAEELAEHAVEEIFKMHVPHAASEAAKYVTASVGFVTLYPSEKVTVDDMIIAADDALYQAKAKGRNCAVEAKMKESAEVIELSLSD